MLKAISDFFDRYMVPEDAAAEQADDDKSLRLAIAALMLEMTRADFQTDNAERAAVTAAVEDHFSLAPDQAHALIELAEAELKDSTDYFQFTSLINRHFSAERKRQLVESLWRIAYADDQLHKYEEHLVRRVAELLHVPHGAFIAAKHKAADS